MAVQISKNPTIYTPSNNVPTQTSSVPTASITASNSAASTTKETLTYEAKSPDTSNPSNGSNSGNTVNNSNLPKWDRYENGIYYKNGVAYSDPGCMCPAATTTPPPTPMMNPTVTNQPVVTTRVVNNAPVEDPVDKPWGYLGDPKGHEYSHDGSWWSYYQNYSQCGLSTQMYLDELYIMGGCEQGPAFGAGGIIIGVSVGTPVWLMNKCGNAINKAVDTVKNGWNYLTR